LFGLTFSPSRLSLVFGQHSPQARRESNVGGIGAGERDSPVIARWRDAAVQQDEDAAEGETRH